MWKQLTSYGYVLTRTTEVDMLTTAMGMDIGHVVIYVVYYEALLVTVMLKQLLKREQSL